MSALGLERAAAGAKPAAKSVAERQAELRARRADIGHAEVRGAYAHVEDHPEIKQEAAKIVRRRERNAKKRPA